MNTHSIIDSRMTLPEALSGTAASQEIIDTLTTINIDHWSFDRQLHTGQLVIDKTLEAEVRDIFATLKEARFPINKMIPVCAYRWSDNESMADNNSSAFNYRNIARTTRLSYHALGRAIDINPRQNPYIQEGIIQPPGAQRDPDAAGTMTANDVVVSAFYQYGWEWGGDWEEPLDWHHFQKP